jgi:hypothetical protein
MQEIEQLDEEGVPQFLQEQDLFQVWGRGLQETKNFSGNFNGNQGIRILGQDFHALSQS